MSRIIWRRLHVIYIERCCVAIASSGHLLSVTTVYKRVVGLASKIVRTCMMHILIEVLIDSS